MSILPPKNASIRVKVEQGTRTTLEGLAMRQGVGLSELIREALRHYLRDPQVWLESYEAPFIDSGAGYPVAFDRDAILAAEYPATMTDDEQQAWNETHEASFLANGVAVLASEVSEIPRLYTAEPAISRQDSDSEGK